MGSQSEVNNVEHSPFETLTCCFSHPHWPNQSIYHLVISLLLLLLLLLMFY